jgi:hypothetical protein
MRVCAWKNWATSSASNEKRQHQYVQIERSDPQRAGGQPDLWRKTLTPSQRQIGEVTMTEKVTLELSEEMIQRAHAAADRTGRAFEVVLADWIARGAERDVESLIIPGVEYPIYTPFGNEGAAQVLQDTLNAHKANKAREHK